MFAHPSRILLVTGLLLASPLHAATLSSQQMLQDLEDTCAISVIIDDNLSDNISTDTLDDGTGRVVQAASFDPLSSSCSRFFQETARLSETYGNDPAAYAAALQSLADDITPDELPALYTSLVQLSTDQIRNISHHLRNHRNEAGRLSADSALIPLRDYVGGTAGSDSVLNRLSLFVDGSRVQGDQIESDYETGYDLDTDHYTLGLDYYLNPYLLVGAAYGNSDTRLQYRQASNQTDNRTDHYLLYGSWYRDNFAVDAVLGMASGTFDTRRTILGSTALGSTDSNQYYVSLAGSYDFSTGSAAYGPHASLEWLDGEIDAFEESDGGGWEAAFDRQDVQSRIMTMGVHGSYAMSTAWGVLLPHARAEWRTELEDERDLIAGRFVQDPASTFTLAADAPDNRWYQLSAGLSAQFAHGLAAFLDYEEVLEYDDTDLGIVTLGIRWEL